MKTTKQLSFYLFVAIMTMATTQSDALLVRSIHFSNRSSSFHSNISQLAANAFEQMPGESDMDFIKRVTSNSKDLLEESISAEKMEENEKPARPTGQYQRIEDWDAERQAKGELSWEEKVMFDGQRHGNQIRQNDILNRNLHSF